MVEGRGFKVVEARDGREAVECFRSRRDEIEAVILDLTMPVMDGSTAMTEIRRIRSDVPVVFITGFTEQPASAVGPDVEPVGFVHKPFDEGELMRGLRGVLESDRTAQSEAPTGSAR